MPMRVPGATARAAVFVTALALGLAGVGVAVPGLGTAHASILMALELPELVRQSQHIAVVEVASINAAWDERHERIYSTIELKVIESWKNQADAPAGGQPPQRLTIVQPGGTVGDISMTVTGLGSFSPGERSVVFLRGPADHAQVVGMTQGKRPMRFESTTKRWMVSPPDLRSATLVKPPVTSPTLPPVRGAATPASPTARSLTAPPATPSGSAAAVTTRPAPPRSLPLDEMRDEVKKLLGARAP
jgi:hypothetical protein